MLYNPQWQKQDKFRSTWRLGIRRKHRNALIQTLHALEGGLISDDDFNMGSWWGCLWGQCRQLTGVEVPRFGLWHYALFDLFTGYRCGRLIGVEKGARALRNYLETGHAHWEKVQAQ